MSTFDPDALECLAAIVEEGGFERAAVRLSITQSAVSQRLRALEAQVGTVLIVRSRPLKPTTAGQLLLKHAMQMRLLRADLERDLQELAPSSTGSGREEERISIAVNADSIATWALPAPGPLARRACRWRSSPTTRTSPTNGCAKARCWAASPRSGRPCAAARSCRWVPWTMWPWPRPAMPKPMCPRA
jgi:DNA-binding transcriptional LysR family regulator